MNHSLLLQMTLRLIRRRHKSSSRPIFGSVVGIALSMIPLIVVLFLSDGMIRGITDRFIETGTFHLQLRSYGSLEIDEWKKTAREAALLPGVETAELEHSGMGLAYAGSEQSAVQLRSIDPGLIERDPGFRTYIRMLEGRFDLGAADAIVIGRESAETLGLSVGDSLKVMTGKTLSTGKYIPRISRFRITGIFTTGYQDLDRLWAFIPLNKGLKILKDRDSSTRIMIKCADPYGELSPLVSSLRSLLQGGRWGIYTWQSLNRSQQSNYQTTRMLLILIMVLIVLVAVMNISSSMVMLVMDNEQEIGILKSMGMENGFLIRQYVLTSAVAGGTGSLIGIALGCWIAVRFNLLIHMAETLVNGLLSLYYGIAGGINPGPVALLNREYYLENFRVSPDAGILIPIFISTVLLSMAAALIPVRHIGRIRPLDILRKH